MHGPLCAASFPRVPETSPHVCPLENGDTDLDTPCPFIEEKTSPLRLPPESVPASLCRNREEIIPDCPGPLFPVLNDPADESRRKYSWLVCYTFVMTRSAVERFLVSFSHFTRERHRGTAQNIKARVYSGSACLESTKPRLRKSAQIRIRNAPNPPSTGQQLQG